MKRKNSDYAKDTDPFRNFRAHGLLGISVRMQDKVSRLTSFSERGELSVVEESVRDTVLDLVNYAVLYYGYMLDTQEKTAHEGPDGYSTEADAIDLRGCVRMGS